MCPSDAKMSIYFLSIPPAAPLPSYQGRVRWQGIKTHLDLCPSDNNIFTLVHL